MTSTLSSRRQNASIIHSYMYIIWNYILLYVLGAWCLLQQLLHSHKESTDLEDPSGRVCVITGGGRGIGLETVKQLKKLNMIIIIAGRCSQQMKNVAEALQEIQGREVRIMELDLSDLYAIHQFVKEFKSLNLPLHLLINNAGVMFVPERRTEEGLEYHWCVNYLGHVLLSHLLLPQLISSGTKEFPSRIVNLSSSVSYVGTINFDDINSEECYSAEAAYAQSKLAVVMFTKILSNKLSSQEMPVLVNCIHPGVVMSQLFENVTWVKWLPWLARGMLKNTVQGADTVVHVALSKLVTEGGDYYENCSITQPASASENLAHQKQLWDLSCKQLHINNFGI